MKKVIIDGLTINNEEELHEFLQKELELPDYYGKNLNALWDCITGWIDLPIFIIWENYEICKNSWGEQFTKDFLELLIDAKKELGDKFNFEYK